MQIRAKLFWAITGLSFVVLSSTSWVVYLDSRAALEQRIESDQLLLARLQKQRIQRWVEEERQRIRLFTTRGAMDEIADEVLLAGQSSRAELARLNLERALKATSNEALAIHLMDSEQRVRFSTRQELEGQRLPQVVPSQGSEPAVAWLSTPISPDGGLVTIERLPYTAPPLWAVMESSAEAFISEVVSSCRIGDTGECVLGGLASDGQVTLHTPTRFPADRRLAPEAAAVTPVHQALVKGLEGLAGPEARDYRGQPVVAAVYRVPTTPWAIAVKMDREEAFAPVKRLFYALVSIILCGSAISAVLAVLISGRLARPLNALTDATLKRTPFPDAVLARSDEVGMLGRALAEKDLAIAQAAHQKDMLLGRERAAQLRMSFLARAGPSFNRTLNPDGVTRGLAQVALPDYADWFAVLLLDGDRPPQVRLVCAPNAPRAEAAARLEGLPGLRAFLEDVLGLQAHGEPLLSSEVPERLLEGNDEARTLLRAMGCRSRVRVPLRADAEALGCLVFVRSEDSPPYGPDDVPLAHDLAERMALALRNSQLYRQAREAEAKLKLAHEAARAGTWEWEVRSGALGWSEGFSQLHGLPVWVQPSYAAWLGCVHPQDRERVDGELKDGVRAGELRSEFRILHPEQGERWVLSVGKTVFSPEDEPQQLRGIVLDITERRRAEADLRAALQLLELHVANSPLGVIEWNSDLVVTKWSGAAEKIFGFSANEVVGRSVFDLALLDEAEWPKMQEVVDALLAPGAKYRVSSHRHRTRDGRALTCEWYNSAVSDGHRTSVLSLVLDVTEREQVGEALRESNRRKDEFLAMLAHELRNPLAPIRAALPLLEQTAGEEAGRYLEVITRQTENLRRLVDDLLDVSRITRGMIELRKERLDAADVVTRAIEAARPLLERSSHRLSMKLPGETLLVVADPVRLEQVVVNLLTNAAKYTPAGGDIEVELARDAGKVVLRVKDSGIGIEREMLSGVFALFAQQRRGLDRAEGGLGIGLTICKNLIELHGGNISAHSDGPGRGAEFRVELPLLAKAPSLVSMRPQAATRPGPQGRLVLVVDDNRDAAEMLAELLESWGHQVRLAYDGEEALEMAQAAPPEVVLLDIGLPLLDGYEVARRIRANPRLGTPLLVALTGYGQESDRARAHEAGFDRHMVKPVDVDALRQLLQAPGERASA